MALASIFINTGQSQHTLTAIFSGRYRAASTAYDEAVAEGCQYELLFIASALVDGKVGICKRVGLLVDVTAPSEVWQVQELHFAVGLTP
jgi:hypothetical protein